MIRSPAGASILARSEPLYAVAQVLATKQGVASSLGSKAAADRLYALLSEEQYGLMPLTRELFPAATPRRPAGGLPDGVAPSVTAGQ